MHPHAQVSYYNCPTPDLAALRTPPPGALPLWQPLATLCLSPCQASARLDLVVPLVMTAVSAVLSWQF